MDFNKFVLPTIHIDIIVEETQLKVNWTQIDHFIKKQAIGTLIHNIYDAWTQKT